MPYVSSSSYFARSVNSREAKGVADARQASSQLARNLVDVGQLQRTAAKPPDVWDRTQRRSTTETDRRKVNQRILRQPTLFDLRSGIDRRHHNQRASDIAEHIDVTV